MDPDTRLDELRALWQDQAVEPVELPADLGEKADGFRATIAARNRREWVAAAIVGAVFTAYAVFADTTLARVGNLLVSLGAAYVAWHLHAHGRTRAPEGLPCLTYHRRELERQRDLLRGVWRWYIGPTIPGFVVLTVDRALTDRVHWWAVAFVVLVFAAVGWLNRRAAVELQRQLDALPVPEPIQQP